MLTSYKNIPALLLLIATKIILAIGIGYLTAFIYGKIFKSAKPEILIHEHDEHHHDEDHHEEHEEHHDEEHIHACCHHDLNDTGFDWKHPLVHCLKITLYIFIINFIFERKNKALPVWLMAVIGLVTSIVSQVGDLAMSVIKRQFGIKDYGRIFPGHGGFLDRFDSVLAVAVVLAVAFGIATGFAIL